MLHTLSSWLVAGQNLGEQHDRLATGIPAALCQQRSASSRATVSGRELTFCLDVPEPTLKVEDRFQNSFRRWHRDALPSELRQDQGHE